jgi:hypothetical protein
MWQIAGFTHPTRHCEVRSNLYVGRSNMQSLLCIASIGASLVTWVCGQRLTCDFRISTSQQPTSNHTRLALKEYNRPVCVEIASYLAMTREEKYITRNPLYGEAEERVDKRSDVRVSPIRLNNGPTKNPACGRVLFINHSH